MAKKKTTTKKDSNPSIKKEQDEMEDEKIFNYFKVMFMLKTEQLGSCAEVSIYEEHILKKAMKNIRKANQLSGKLTKVAEQWYGKEIPEDKYIKELKFITNNYLELTGDTREELPDDVDELLSVANEIEQKYKDMINEGDSSPSTIFMKEMIDGKMWPVISSHMILGNMKANMRTMVNNGDKSILRSKVSVAEVFAVDVAPVEDFLVPDQDIVKDENGERVLCERVVNFDRMGKTITAINRSEILAPGTQYECTLRIRHGSPIDEKALIKIFSIGRNHGIGPWRGSGGRGQYFFKLIPLPDYKEEIPDGWM